jgi:hypothetical protein
MTGRFFPASFGAAGRCRPSCRQLDDGSDPICTQVNPADRVRDFLLCDDVTTVLLSLMLPVVSQDEDAGILDRRAP